MTPSGRLRHHLECAVEGHQSRFDAQLRMASSELLAKLGQRVPVGLRLGSGVGDGRLTVGNLCGATVTMVDHNDLVDAVQLNRGPQVVPERLMPILERGRHDTYGRASDRELTVLAGEMASSGVLADECLKAWVDTGQDHRFVLAAGRKRVPRHECGGSETTGSNLQKTASIEGWVEQGRTAGAGGVVTNRVSQVPLHLIPPGITHCEPGRSLRTGQRYQRPSPYNTYGSSEFMQVVWLSHSCLLLMAA